VQTGDEGVRSVVPLLLVVAPFVVALARVLATAGQPIHLPDDLALIQLHTRDAMAFHQAVGPFDRYGWSHPGPAYFYLQAIVGWLFGPGSWGAAGGAFTVGSFVVQTDVSALPIIVVTAAVALGAWLLTRLGSAGESPLQLASTPWRRVWWAVVAGLGILEWVPPIVQDASGHEDRSERKLSPDRSDLGVGRRRPRSPRSAPGSEVGPRLPLRAARARRDVTTTSVASCRNDQS
jgi:hypothetical protein